MTSQDPRPDQLREKVGELLNEIPNAFTGQPVMVDDVFLAARVTTVDAETETPFSTVSILHTFQKNPWQLVGILLVELIRAVMRLISGWPGVSYQDREGGDDGS